MKVLSLYISPSHIYVGRHGKGSLDVPMQAVEQVECIAGKGIEGDRYFDHKPDFKGQITFFSKEVYDALCEEYAVFDRDPWVFRRNVLVEGKDLNELIGQEFEVQGVRFSGSEEARPCYWMEEAFCPGAEASLKGRGGLRARILTNGTLRSAA
ncbi:MAG: MOSC domain-containing protein [Verrucomicrobiota bacterium]